MKPADERDTIFSRMKYRKGTPQYEDYYSQHPEKEDLDRKLREMPDLCSPGTLTYDPLNSPMADATFQFLEDIRPLVDGPSSTDKIMVDPDRMTGKIKALAEYYGASMTGIAELQAEHYYSVKGRPLDDYGKKVDPSHPYGIVVGSPMDMDMMNRAPDLPVLVESSLSYVRVAIIGMLLSYYIRSLGYKARNHMDGNYLVIPNRVAKDAGLGEFGRCGMLVTRKYGPAVRFAVVTTDLPLIPDRPVEFGLQGVCEKCGNCAIQCPVGALSRNHKPDRWKVDAEKCYEYWRTVGTDCSICIMACPFSQGLGADFKGNYDEDPEAVLEMIREFRERFGEMPQKKEPAGWM